MKRALLAISGLFIVLLMLVAQPLTINDVVWDVHDATGGGSTVSANFCGTNGVIELDENEGPQGPYPINFGVSGILGSLSQVTVTLTNFTHNFPSDLQMVLVAPDNNAVKFWGGAGGNSAISANVTITLSDSASGYVPDPSPASGTYKPTDIDASYVFPVGPPAGPYSTNFSTFTGMAAGTANGLWKIYIADDTALDGGRLTNVCITLISEL